MFLADSEARFRALADNSADVVWRFFSEPYPHFDYLSPSIEKILGYPASVFLDGLQSTAGNSRPPRQRAHPPFVERRTDAPSLRPPVPLSDGSIVILETQTTDIRGGLQGVSRDVTELRSLQENLAARACVIH